MSNSFTDLPSAVGHGLRSGTAARLAGLPVTTLRVWERRYDVSAGARTSSGQRIYTADDVARLRLLRRLTNEGHAIGTIAGLDLRSLRALADAIVEPDGRAARPAPHALHAVVIGSSAARVLQGLPGCVLRAVHDDLDTAESSDRSQPDVELLLVRLPSLQPADVDRIIALGAKFGAEAVVVVYGFSSEASAETLASAGVAVRREPLTSRRLGQWLRPLRAASAAPRPGLRVAGLAAPEVRPRRFSDDALTRLAEMPPTVACECMRHVVEIVVQLAGFERYSDDCIKAQPADAALHRYLERTAGAARTMFEDALQRLVDEARPST